MLSASFKYDALGRRIEKTINGRTIKYLYDGLDIVQEIENSVPTVNYIRTLNIDEPLARVQSDGKVRYYHTDALGSVIALTDETGAIKTTYSYDPFGNVTISSEASDNSFQYTGRENDGTGLYYYRARYYSSDLQRFISEDPIGLAGGINMYSYVGNNPVNFIDPWGLLKYNTDDTAVTGRLSGDTLTFAECMEKCAGFELTVTGGSEKTGHSEGSKHYTGEACDFSDAKNPKLDKDTVQKCYKECTTDNYWGQKEGGKYPHWHFQIVPGKGNATGLKP